MKIISSSGVAWNSRHAVATNKSAGDTWGRPSPGPGRDSYTGTPASPPTSPPTSMIQGLQSTFTQTPIVPQTPQDWGPMLPPPQEQQPLPDTGPEASGAVPDNLTPDDAAPDGAANAVEPEVPEASADTPPPPPAAGG